MAISVQGAGPQALSLPSSSSPLSRSRPWPALATRLSCVRYCGAALPLIRCSAHPNAAVIVASAICKTLTAFQQAAAAFASKQAAAAAVASTFNGAAAAGAAAVALRSSTLPLAAISSVNTPLTVVASGMAKWLELYSGVLMVRVLLSWFPNIPWERQPLQAIRDMCDPYLNLFRNIIPPLFNALDVSPLLAFLVLGVLTSILNTTIHA